MADNDEINLSDDEEPVHSGEIKEVPLSDAEKELIMADLVKTEDEINTLKQVLANRQTYAVDLRRRLGVAGKVDVLTQEANKTIDAVMNTQAFKKTTAVANAGADTVRNGWNGMINSNLFKNVENTVNQAISTSATAAKTGYSYLAGYNTMPMKDDE